VRLDPRVLEQELAEMRLKRCATLVEDFEVLFIANPLRASCAPVSASFERFVAVSGGKE
jgi:hypothetical protein